jgi:hypothetical protein
VAEVLWQYAQFCLNKSEKLSTRKIIVGRYGKTTQPTEQTSLKNVRETMRPNDSTTRFSKGLSVWLNNINPFPTTVLHLLPSYPPEREGFSLSFIL